VNTVLNTFDKMLPTSFFLKDFKSLPTTSMYLTAGLFNLGYIIAFMYFIITAYDSGVTDSYISFDQESGDCVEVASSTTGNFLADMAGQWETSPKFDASRALYGTDFLAYSHTNAEYNKLMNKTNAFMFNRTGEKGSHRDLAWNMIAASSFTVKAKQNGSLEMFPTGELMTMVNQEFFQSSIFKFSDGVETNLQYPCTAFETHSGVNAGKPTKAYFTMDLATSKFKVGFSYSTASTDCAHIATSFGYKDDYGDMFEMQLDVNSFSTAVAVNYGILNSSFLVKIKDYADQGYAVDDYYGSGYSYYYDDANNASSASESNAKPASRRALLPKGKKEKRSKGLSARKLNEDSVDVREAHRLLTGTSMEFYLYFDAKFDMQPITCVVFNKDDEDLQCFVYYPTNGTFGFPIIKHYGNGDDMTDCSDKTAWGPTWYNSDPTSNGDWTNTYDHTFDVLMGLILFNSFDDALSYASDARTALKASYDGDLTIADRVWPNLRAMVDVPFYGGGTYNTYNSADVCGINSKGVERTCMMWTFNVYGQDSYFTNPQNTQLFAGACRNSLYLDSAFKLVATIPPTPLVQTYYSCTLIAYDSFFAALGLSLGNADIYARAFLFLVMSIFISYRLCTKTIDPEILSSGHYESPKQAEAAKVGEATSDATAKGSSPMHLHNNL